MPLKICILIETLNKGGAERSAGLLSKILSNLGHKVYLITIFDDIAYPFEGELINIGTFKNTSGSKRNKFNRYWQIGKQLKKLKFDLVLDFRIKDAPIRELILNLFVFKKEKMINMVRSYNLEWYFPKPKFLSKYLYKNYLSINTVSLDIKEHIENVFNFINVASMYSPIDIEYIKKKAEEELIVKDKFIVAIGRLEPIKQFNKLIEAYSNTVLPNNNINLLIMGTGSQNELLTTTIRKLKLEDKVKLIPFQENPFNYLKHAEFSILSSKNEGFPRVIIESLACETPVVSFNCKSGPFEIINHKKNGLLVKDQDFDALSRAMDKMIKNEALYNFCKTNCLESINRFSINSVKENWTEYLNKLT